MRSRTRRRLAKMSNYELLTHYTNAVQEDHYLPYGEPYNESGCKTDELKEEILKRLNKLENNGEEE